MKKRLSLVKDIKDNLHMRPLYSGPIHVTSYNLGRAFTFGEA